MKKIILFYVAATILIAGCLAYFYKKPAFIFEKMMNTATTTPAITFKTEMEKDDVYVQFAMEVYDSIQTNYWNSGKNDLENIYLLAVQKILGLGHTLETHDRVGVAKLVTESMKDMTDNAKKKEFVLNLAQVVLYNLVPVARNTIYTSIQETAMRNEVKNVNPDKNLYDVIGVPASSTPAKIASAYEQKVEEIKAKPQTEETKEQLKQVTYANKVLADKNSRNQYDTTKIEPTIFASAISSSVMYLNMTKFSPTSLNEFVSNLNSSVSRPDLKALIIDMRGNIGGAIDFLPYFIGAFVGPNLSAYDIYKQGTTTPIKTIATKFDPLVRFKKIVLLVDSMSQSSAEAFAASVKRYHAAVVVGNTTRGWGTIENTFPISTVIDPAEKYTLYLVHSLTLREDGQPIESRGVDPDVDVKNANWKAQLDEYFNYSPLNSTIEKLLKSGPVN